MQAMQSDFSAPDEVREFPHGHADIIHTDSGPVARLVLHAGWKWSNDIGPIAGTDLCQSPHFQYHVSGRIHVVTSDGAEFDVGPGEISAVEPGHDAWVVGDEDVVVIDFGGATTFAKPVQVA